MNTIAINLLQLAIDESMQAALDVCRQYQETLKGLMKIGNANERTYASSLLGPVDLVITTLTTATPSGWALTLEQWRSVANAFSNDPSPTLVTTPSDPRTSDGHS